MSFRSFILFSISCSSSSCFSFWSRNSLTSSCVLLLLFHIFFLLLELAIMCWAYYTLFVCYFVHLFICFVINTCILHLSLISFWRGIPKRQLCPPLVIEVKLLQTPSVFASLPLLLCSSCNRAPSNCASVGRGRRKEVPQEGLLKERTLLKDLEFSDQLSRATASRMNFVLSLNWFWRSGVEGRRGRDRITQKRWVCCLSYQRKR